jgi:coenzyme PQQ precursor peptide PqqA
MNLPEDACCAEMGPTADRSAPPHARGAVPAYYLDRSSVRRRACLNAPASKACNGGKTHLSMPPNLKEENMTWNAPKIVEVAVGMEINMYACASRKT